MSQIACPLQDLLAEVQQGGSGVDHLALAGVLVNAAKSADDGIRATALRWLAAFVADAKPALLPLYAAILQAILPALSSQHADILQARARQLWLLMLPPVALPAARPLLQAMIRCCSCKWYAACKGWL